MPGAGWPQAKDQGTALRQIVSPHLLAFSPLALARVWFVPSPCVVLRACSGNTGAIMSGVVPKQGVPAPPPTPPISASGQEQAPPPPVAAVVQSVAVEVEVPKHTPESVSIRPKL